MLFVSFLFIFYCHGSEFIGFLGYDDICKKLAVRNLNNKLLCVYENDNASASVHCVTKCEDIKDSTISVLTEQCLKTANESTSVKKLQ